VLDDAQRAAAAVLAQSATTAGRRSRPALSRLLGPSHQDRPRRSGVYLWGDVGRGKTWLMDAFVANLHREKVLRLHSHVFFRDLHAAIGRHRGRRTVMNHAVTELLEGSTTVAFDELHVHDAGDAMLLAPLIRELVRRRVLWVATSNYPPEQLLGNPLYHHLFVPAIQLIRRYMHVLHIDGPTDHRIGQAAVSPSATGRFSSGAWLVGDTAGDWRSHQLDEPAESHVDLPLGSRVVRAHAVDGRTVWFHFSDLVEGRLSAADYLDLASRFTTWVLLGTPVLRCASEAARQRFVALVDVLCDQDRRLVLAGAPAPERIFEGVVDLPDLPRVMSRLELLPVVRDR
jgi:cell division protein ZapE